MDHAERPLALTLGDPAGIGLDITLLAWLAREHEAIPPFVLLGDPTVLEERAEALGLGVPVATIAETEAAEGRFAEELPVLPVPVAGTVVAGRPDPAAVPAVQQSIEQAVRLVKDGEARAMVTNPISKAMLYRGGFAFPGHTEYLASLAAGGGQTPHPVMMLAAGPLRVVPATIHIPLKDVPGALTKELVLATIAIADADLRRHFGIARPRIAVTGLNPHAGEDGGIGPRGDRRHRACDRSGSSEGTRRDRVPIPPTRCFTTRRAPPTTLPSACIMTRRWCPFKTLAFDGRRQRHARPAIHTHLTRSRHGVRDCRHGQSEPAQPDRGAAPGRCHELRQRGARVTTPDGLPPLRDVIRASRPLSAERA